MPLWEKTYHILRSALLKYGDCLFPEIAWSRVSLFAELNLVYIDFYVGMELSHIFTLGRNKEPQNDNYFTSLHILLNLENAKFNYGFQ